MKCRYCYNTAVIGRVGHHPGLVERFNNWKRRRNQNKLYLMTGYYPPVYPGK